MQACAEDAAIAFHAVRMLATLGARLAAGDRLNEYITHVGSAVFAVPPGAAPGGYVGETLLG